MNSNDIKVITLRMKMDKKSVYYASVYITKKAP